jgi:hypothetical protein
MVAPAHLSLGDVISAFQIFENRSHGPRGHPSLEGKVVNGVIRVFGQQDQNMAVMAQERPRFAHYYSLPIERH